MENGYYSARPNSKSKDQLETDFNESMRAVAAAKSRKMRLVNSQAKNKRIRPGGSAKSSCRLENMFQALVRKTPNRT